jgi:hypothetical protein
VIALRLEWCKSYSRSTEIAARWRVPAESLILPVSTMAALSCPPPTAARAQAAILASVPRGRALARLAGAVSR